MSMVSETVKSRVGQVQKIALVVGIAGLAGGAQRAECPGKE